VPTVSLGRTDHRRRRIRGRGTASRLWSLGVARTVAGLPATGLGTNDPR